MISPAQCRAARALLHWSQRDLANAAEVGIVTVQEFERGQTNPRSSTRRVITKALEDGGVLFVDENGAGAGVRLRDKSTSDNK